MSELTIRDFRAHLKEYLDRVDEGEVFTLRGGSVHIAAAESCGDHIAEEQPITLTGEDVST